MNELVKEGIVRVIDNSDVDRLEVRSNYIRIMLMWQDHSIEIKIRKFIKTVNITDQQTL